jgi:glycosyltransferase involved in cell wall biosynthesis
MKDKNILYVVHNYNSFQKDQIDAIAKYFNKVYVIVRYKPLSRIVKYLPVPSLKKFDDKFVLDMNEIPENVEVFKASVFYIPFGIFNRLLGRSHYRAVDRVIRKNNLKFDLIHSHFIWSSGYVGMKLKEKYNKPFFVTGHGYDVYKLPFKSEWWKNRISSVLEHADHVLTVSEGNKEYLLGLGVKESVISVVGNGYNSNLFFNIDKNSARRELDIPLQKKVFVSVGNLEEVKGHRYLIDAIKILKEEDPNILCYIVGGGSLYSEYEELVKEYGLQENLFLVGHIRHEDVNKWMNAADLFILPSIQESFGIVQLEALACGTPVIATRTNGSKEVIKSEDYGLLCNVKDPSDLAAKISLGMHKEWTRQMMIEYASSLSWENVSLGIVNVYDTL